VRVRPVHPAQAEIEDDPARLAEYERMVGVALAGELLAAAVAAVKERTSEEPPVDDRKEPPVADVIYRVHGGTAHSPKRLLELAIANFLYQGPDAVGADMREIGFGVVGHRPWHVYVRPGYYIRVCYSRSMVAELTIKNEDGVEIRPSVQIGPIPQSFARSHVRHFLNSFMRQAFATAVAMSATQGMTPHVLRALPQIALRSGISSLDGMHARLVVMKKLALPNEKVVIRRKNFNELNDLKYTVDLRSGATTAVEGIDWQAIADMWGKEQLPKPKQPGHA